jgi:lipoprotein signal peptidase
VYNTYISFRKHVGLLIEVYCIVIILFAACISRESSREVTYSDIGFAAFGNVGRSILGNTK